MIESVRPTGSDVEEPMTGLSRPLAGVVPMDSPGTFLHWGVIQISVANLLVIIVMLVVFVLALLLPFPGRKK
jgi:hypothetical protein